jgi:acetyl esterase/lipase
VLDASRWLIAHASERGVEPERISLMGDSAGGGVAASAAVLARDRDVAVATLILVFPMLDDRVATVRPAIEPFLTWTPEMNSIAWAARVDGTVTPATSPARLEDYRGMPPTYIEVGDLDLFRNESIAFAARLAEADVPLELHVHPSVPHGYDTMAPESGVSRRAMADRVRVLATL